MLEAPYDNERVIAGFDKESRFSGKEKKKKEKKSGSRGWTNSTTTLNVADI